jgi:O-succinylbenzoate synthase
MSIERIEVWHVKVPLKEPFAISSGQVDEKDAIIVGVMSDGITGYGESSPMAGSFYSDETPESCLEFMLNTLLPLMLKNGTTDVDSFGRMVEQIPGRNFAKAGLEMALWDLKAKQQGISLFHLLGGSRMRIPVGLAVGLQDTPSDMVKAISRYLERGTYSRVKIKIKRGQDIEFVKAVRQEFGDIKLMVDANADYSIDDIGVFKELDDYDLTMFEQPFAGHDLENLARLQNAVKTPVCLDESVETLQDAKRAVELGACKIVNIKLQRVGGLANAVKIHDFLSERKVPVWCGYMPELGVSSAVGISLSSLPNFTYETDVDASLRWFADDIIAPLIERDAEGFLQVPTEKEGSGFDVDLDKLSKYTLSHQVYE